MNSFFYKIKVLGLCIVLLFLTVKAKAVTLNAPLGYSNYQWYHQTSSGIVALVGETNVSTNVNLPGVYYVEFESPNCGKGSDYFVLTGNNPGDEQIILNAAAQSGIYQWYQDIGSGANIISGGTNSTLNVAATQTPTTYYAEVTKPNGTVKMPSFTILMLPEENTPTLCSDGIDNDGDGLIDCAEAYCQPIIGSVTTQSPTCSNPTGGQISITVNNSTGWSLLYSITNMPSYQSNSIFNNLERGQYIIRIKNDAGCETAYNTPVVFDLPDCVEICNNGIDDDGDGLVDCDDTDCGTGTVHSINNN